MQDNSETKTPEWEKAQKALDKIKPKSDSSKKDEQVMIILHTLLDTNNILLNNILFSIPMLQK